MVQEWKAYEWVPREVSDWNASSLLFHANTEYESEEDEVI